MNKKIYQYVTKHVHYLEATLVIQTSVVIKSIQDQTKPTCVHTLLPGVTQPFLQMVVDRGTFLW